MSLALHNTVTRMEAAHEKRLHELEAITQRLLLAFNEQQQQIEELKHVKQRRNTGNHRQQGE